MQWQHVSPTFVASTANRGLTYQLVASTSGSWTHQVELTHTQWFYADLTCLYHTLVHSFVSLPQWTMVDLIEKYEWTLLSYSKHTKNSLQFKLGTNKNRRAHICTNYSNYYEHWRRITLIIARLEKKEHVKVGGRNSSRELEWVLVKLDSIPKSPEEVRWIIGSLKERVWSLTHQLIYFVECE